MTFLDAVMCVCVWHGLQLTSRPAKSGAVRGYIKLLPCTPSVWAEVLLHRTQIVFPVDTAQIVFMLDLAPGKVVVESGGLPHVPGPASCLLSVTSHCVLSRHRQRELDHFHGPHRGADRPRAHV